MRNPTAMLMDVDLDGYGLTASWEEVKVTGPSPTVCQAIRDQFKALPPEVRLALAAIEPRLASSVLQVAFGVHQSGAGSRPVGQSVEHEARRYDAGINQVIREVAAI